MHIEHNIQSCIVEEAAMAREAVTTSPAWRDGASSAG